MYRENNRNIKLAGTGIANGFVYVPIDVAFPIYKNFGLAVRGQMQQAGKRFLLDEQWEFNSFLSGLYYYKPIPPSEYIIDGILFVGQTSVGSTYYFLDGNSSTSYTYSLVSSRDILSMGASAGIRVVETHLTFFMRIEGMAYFFTLPRTVIDVRSGSSTYYRDHSRVQNLLFDYKIITVNALIGVGYTFRVPSAKEVLKKMEK